MLFTSIPTADCLSLERTRPSLMAVCSRQRKGLVTEKAMPTETKTPARLLSHYAQLKLAEAASRVSAINLPPPGPIPAHSELSHN